MDRAPASEVGGYGFNSHQERLELRITKMRYWYIDEGRPFWDVRYWLNNNRYSHKTTISAWRFGDKSPPEAMPELLRATLDCIPRKVKLKRDE